MKEYICIKDYYIEDVKVAKTGDIIVMLPDNRTIINTNGQKQIHNLDIIKDLEYFIPTEEKFDNVNKPRHYAEGKIECIDAMIAAYGKEVVMHFCQCNAFKYQWRFNKKNGIEDLKKAQWYQNKYIELSNEYNN